MSENIEKNIDNTKQETVSEDDIFYSGDPIATFVLKELSIQNERLEKASLRQEIANKRQQRVIYSLVIAIIAVVGAFLFYLNQFEVEYNVEQTGVYTFIDSEGNVISADISPDEMTRILEIINGEN